MQLQFELLFFLHDFILGLILKKCITAKESSDCYNYYNRMTKAPNQNRLKIQFKPQVTNIRVPHR